MNLAELIQECKELYNWEDEMNSFYLQNVFIEADGGCGYLWEAWISKDKVGEQGKTPIEAVEKLLLELKKHYGKKKNYDYRSKGS